MISFWCFIVTYSLSRPLYDKQWVILSLTFQGQIWWCIPYMISHSNIWANSAILWDISFKIWVALKLMFQVANVNCKHTIKITYMLSFHCLISNIWPILAPVWDISLPNLNDLEIDLSRSLRSNVMILLNALYMVSYHCWLVTYVHSWLIYDI